MAPRDWGKVVDDFTRVQKIVHLANRMMPERDASAMQTELFKQKRLAYEDELTAQAAAVGCAGRTGTASPAILAGMMEEARTEALGVINTYNYDMALAIRNIASETPTANRNVYAKRLRDWEAVRNEWKSKQIMLWNTVNWQDKAQKEFVARNPTVTEGRVIVEPQSTAVCDICREAVGKGEMTVEEASKYSWPAHLNCPHHNVIKYKPRKVDCAKLWVGTTLEDWFQEIGKELGEKGGAGSGNWGHVGRPGLRGGSTSTRSGFGAAMSLGAGRTAAQRQAEAKAQAQGAGKPSELNRTGTDVLDALKEKRTYYEGGTELDGEFEGRFDESGVKYLNAKTRSYMGDIAPDSFNPDEEIGRVLDVVDHTRSALKDPTVAEFVSSIDEEYLVSHADAEVGVNIIFTTDPSDAGMGSGGPGSMKVFYAPYTAGEEELDKAYRGRARFNFEVEPVYVTTHELHHALGSSSELDMFSDFMALDYHLSKGNTINASAINYKLDNMYGWARGRASGEFAQDKRDTRRALGLLYSRNPDAVRGWLNSTWYTDGNPTYVNDMETRLKQWGK